MSDLLRRHVLWLGLAGAALPAVAMSPLEMLVASDAIRIPAGSFSAARRIPPVPVDQQLDTAGVRPTVRGRR